MATHSSILAWRILWMEDPGGLPSMGSHRVGHGWSNWACMQSYWYSTLSILSNTVYVKKEGRKRGRGSFYKLKVGQQSWFSVQTVMDIKAADGTIQLSGPSEWAAWMFISLIVHSVLFLHPLGPIVSYRPDSAWRERRARFCFPARPPAHVGSHLSHWQTYDSGSGTDWVPASVCLPCTLCLHPPLCSEGSRDTWDSPCVQPWLPCLLQPFRLLTNKHAITHSKWEYPLVRNDQGQTSPGHEQASEFHWCISRSPQLCRLLSQVT